MMLRKLWAAFFGNTVASPENPVPVENLWMLPDGAYRMRNFEVVSVRGGGDNREWLRRAAGCSLPSLIPLRWSKRGKYGPYRDHPFDLVEYLGADVSARVVEPRPRMSVFSRN